jgi:hypothetical protein
MTRTSALAALLDPRARRTALRTPDRPDPAAPTAALPRDLHGAAAAGALQADHVLHLQRTAGNRAAAGLVQRAPLPSTMFGGEKRKKGTVPAGPSPALPGSVMSREDLLTQGKAAKDKNGKRTTYGRIVDQLGAFHGSSHAGDRVGHLEGLQASVAAWRKKHWIQDKLSTTKLGTKFGRAKGLQALQQQLQSNEAPLRAQERQRQELEEQRRIAESRKLGRAALKDRNALRKMNRMRKLGTSILAGTGHATGPVKKGSSNKFTPMGSFGLREANSLPDIDNAAAEAARDRQMAQYLPLLARTLGLKGVAMASDITPEGDLSKTVMEKAEGQTLLHAILTDTLPQTIDLDRLQQLALFDMISEAQDAHNDNYTVSKKGMLTRIDVDDALLPERKSQHGKAGSSIVGLPQANEMLTPSTLELIRNWDDTRLRQFMANANLFGEKQSAFTGTDTERVLGNIGVIRNILADNQNISIRELFDSYNKEAVAKGHEGDKADPEMPSALAARVNKFRRTAINDNTKQSWGDWSTAAIYDMFSTGHRGKLFEQAFGYLGRGEKRLEAEEETAKLNYALQKLQLGRKSFKWK